MKNPLFLLSLLLYSSCLVITFLFCESENPVVYKRSIKDLQVITAYYEQKAQQYINRIEHELIKPLPDTTVFAMKEMMVQKYLHLHDDLKPSDTYGYYILYAAKYDKKLDNNEYQLISFFLENSFPEWYVSN